MSDILALAGTNLVSPIILSFVLGLAAALARSDLTFPEAIAKGLSLYLLFAIGFKGGAGVAAHGVEARLVAALLAGVMLSLLLPAVAFALLRLMSRKIRRRSAATILRSFQEQKFREWRTKCEINCTPLSDPVVLHARKAAWDKAVASNGGFHPSLAVADTRLLQRARHTAVPAIRGAGLHPNRTVWVRNPREATPSGFTPHNKFRSATSKER